METKISRSDFKFVKEGHGVYRVIYTSPKTNKQWVCITCDMPLIDATKNTDEPKKKDLERLKRACKGIY